MIKEDYIMRIIHEMVRAILELVFGIKQDRDQEILFEDSELAKAYLDLQRLAGEGRIEDAENLLYDSLSEEPEGFKLALLFYDSLNGYTDEQLEDGGFSREEITEGILAAAKRYGYESMAEALLEKEE